MEQLKIPEHVAIILDGNGRWAKKRKMPRTYGHHEGTKTIRDIALKCNEDSRLEFRILSKIL